MFICSGDITTDTFIDPAARGKAWLVSREDLVLPGLPVFRRVFEQLSAEIELEHYVEDARSVPSGERISLVSGPHPPYSRGSARG